MNCKEFGFASEECQMYHQVQQELENDLRNEGCDGKSDVVPAKKPVADQCVMLEKDMMNTAAAMKKACFEGATPYCKKASAVHEMYQV